MSVAELQPPYPHPGAGRSRASRARRLLHGRTGLLHTASRHPATSRSAIGLDTGSDPCRSTTSQCGGAPQPVRAAEVFLAEIPIKLTGSAGQRDWTHGPGVPAHPRGGVRHRAPAEQQHTGGVDFADLRRSPAQPARDPRAGPLRRPPRRPGNQAAAVPAPSSTFAVQVTADPHHPAAGPGRRRQAPVPRRPDRPGAPRSGREGQDHAHRGRRGRVRLKVNGKNLGPPGGRGERVTRSFRPPRAR